VSDFLHFGGGRINRQDAKIAKVGKYAKGKTNLIAVSLTPNFYFLAYFLS
jgi:hypothetical protein